MLCAFEAVDELLRVVAAVLVLDVAELDEEMVLVVVMASPGQIPKAWSAGGQDLEPQLM